METTSYLKSAEIRSRSSTDFRVFLQAELIRRCRETQGYSLRAFARALETDASTLAKLLKSKRPIGKITLRNLGSKLGLSPQEIEEFMASRAARAASASTESQPSGATSDPEWQQITAVTFEIIADWYHYAILELIRLDSWKKDARWIAKTLSVPVHEINAALDRLQRAGILEITEEGRWVDHSEGRSTNIAQPYFDAAHRRMQKQILEKAIRAIEEVPVALRDQSSMTMAIDTELLGEAKARIKKFRRELAQFLSRGTRRDQVYHMTLSLYPVTRIENEEKGKES